ncbi:MAG: KH domain-containing protein [Erysipelotrichaceae bacterium]|nr:KH domain-containing protein [Erysipelotrichaceae bacterium]
MVDCKQVLLDLVKPIVDDPQTIRVEQRESLDENEVLLFVYAKSEDIARLIGRQGSMAMAIRNTMSIASRLEGKRISVKFESYEDAK